MDPRLWLGGLVGYLRHRREQHVIARRLSRYVG